MRNRPRGEKGRLVLLHFKHERSNALRRPSSKSMRLFLWALNKPWKDDRHEKRDDRECDKSGTANTTNLSCQVVGRLCLRRCIKTEVDLANPGGAVE